MNQAQSQSLDVRGVKTRYFKEGKGQTVVFIHGGQYGHYYSADAWSLNFSPLTNFFEVIAFDKLGMGYTDNPVSDSDYTMNATIAHAREFLETLEVRDATVVGHSRGALVAARLAMDKPDLIKSLVIVDSNTLSYDDPSVPREFYEKIERSLPSSPTRESVCLEAIANSYSTSHITEDFIDEMYAIALQPKILDAKQKMKSNLGVVFREKLNALRIKALEDIRLGKLRKPTLILWGLNDPSAPYVLANDLYRLISSCNDRTELHFFNQAGHYSFREKANDFNAVLKSFVESL